MGTRDSGGRNGLRPELAAKLAAAPFVVGTDEVGLGAWAGDLVVVGVLVPNGWDPPDGLTDSKDTSETTRKRLFNVLLADPNIRHRVSTTTSDQIDEIGVGKALIQAHLSLHESFRIEAQEALCIADGNLSLGPGIFSEPRADMYVPAVSAASIIAKVTRDKMMREADALYPGYGFASHNGYGGDERHAHTVALRKLGPCPIHRRSYKPVARVIQESSVDESLFTWEVPLGDPWVT